MNSIKEQLQAFEKLSQWLDVFVLPVHLDFESICIDLAKYAPTHNLPLGVFKLERAVDVTGVSGTGLVAYGIDFGNDGVVIGWLGKYQTLTHHKSMESVEAIHCHNGATKVVWI